MPVNPWKRVATESFGQGIITSLTGFVGVVGAFYFGTSAWTDKAKTDKDAKIAVAKEEADATKQAARDAARAAAGQGAGG